MQLFSIIILTFISSFISLIGALFLSFKKDWPKKFLLQLTALSSGVLLATALLHLAPEAVEQLEPHIAFGTILVAISVFFSLEKIFLWHHHHEEAGCCGKKPSAYLVMISDTIHNFVDGVLIAGTFLVTPELGLFTAVAVAAHEVPQEIADFSVMVAGGMERKKALLLNLISAMSSVLGAVLTFYFASLISGIVPYILAASAGMFLYISLSDLIPELHSHHDIHENQKWSQLILFFVGILIIYGLTLMELH